MAEDEDAADEVRGRTKHRIGSDRIGSDRPWAHRSSSDQRSAPLCSCGCVADSRDCARTGLAAAAVSSSAFVTFLRPTRRWSPPRPRRSAPSRPTWTRARAKERRPARPPRRPRPQRRPQRTPTPTSRRTPQRTSRPSTMTSCKSGKRDGARCGPRGQSMWASSQLLRWLAAECFSSRSPLRSHTTKPMSCSIKSPAPVHWQYRYRARARALMRWCGWRNRLT